MREGQTMKVCSVRYHSRETPEVVDDCKRLTHLSENRLLPRLIMAATLSVAPPGYEIERVIGSACSYNAKSYGTGLFLKSDTLKLIGRVERDLLEIVKKQGGNAILNEHVDVQQTVWSRVAYRGH